MLVLFLSKIKSVFSEEIRYFPCVIYSEHLPDYVQDIFSALPKKRSENADICRSRLKLKCVPKSQRCKFEMRNLM